MITGNKHLRILISGNKGYLGQHLSKWLFNNTDWDICGVDKKDGFDLLGDKSIQHLETYDCVIHLASLTGIRASRVLIFTIIMTMYLSDCKLLFVSTECFQIWLSFKMILMQV